MLFGYCIVCALLERGDLLLTCVRLQDVVRLRGCLRMCAWHTLHTHRIFLAAYYYNNYSIMWVTCTTPPKHMCTNTAYSAQQNGGPVHTRTPNPKPTQANQCKRVFRAQLAIAS